MRNVPPEHILRISWEGDNVEWSTNEFSSHLLQPLQAFLASANLSSQISYVVVSMDIPYRVIGTRANSTTSALFYGFKASSKNVVNSYAASEMAFPEGQPDTAPGYSFLAMMLTSDTLEAAKSLVNAGAHSDGLRPSSPALLAKSLDPVRNLRYKDFDNAVLNARLCNNYNLERVSLTTPVVQTNVLGFQTGLPTLTVPADTFVPGALADNLTSFGGKIFEDTGQTTLLSFINAGATASYGTVTEPNLFLEKFPNPMIYFYQARGFTAAEAYYQSLEVPLEGLLVGEPLSAPFRNQFSGGWSLQNNSVLASVTNLSLSFQAQWPGGTVGRIDLFVDGHFHTTLTNLSPTAGNELQVYLNGYKIDFLVPQNSSLHGVATNLANTINLPLHTNITQVTARAIGDRIELQYHGSSLPGDGFEFIDSRGSDGRSYYVSHSYPQIIPTVTPSGFDLGGGFRLQFDSTLGQQAVLEASSNLLTWLPLVTNASGGLMEFVDEDAALFTRRFYRLSVAKPPNQIVLSPVGMSPGGGFEVSVNAPAGIGYYLQSSTDLNIWSDIYTNNLGGFQTVTDTRTQSAPYRFYRSRALNATNYSPFIISGITSQGWDVLQVQDARPGHFVIWSSTNNVDWSPVFRRSSDSSVVVEASSSRGNADALTTFVRASCPAFLKSTAHGLRAFTVSTNSPVTAGAFLHLAYITTNGLLQTVGATNLIPGVNLKQFVGQFVAQINSLPGLQGPDGIIAEDLVDGVLWAAQFNLRARSAGWTAAIGRARLTSSSSLTISPGGEVLLDGNVNDLRDRNHLYVTEGRPQLSLTAPFDTTQWPDGFHTLTAVGYEGSHVQSQTLKRLSVVISNSPLEAVISVPTEAQLTTSSFNVTVTANTAAVSDIKLFSTGGLVGVSSHQSSSTFPVDAALLQAGRHPFYALVNAIGGLRYRTKTEFVDIVRP